MKSVSSYLVVWHILFQVHGKQQLVLHETLTYVLLLGYTSFYWISLHRKIPLHPINEPQPKGGMSSYTRGLSLPLNLRTYPASFIKDLLFYFHSSCQWLIIVQSPLNWFLIRNPIGDYERRCICYCLANHAKLSMVSLDFDWCLMIWCLHNVLHKNCGQSNTVPTWSVSHTVHYTTVGHIWLSPRSLHCQ